MHCGPLRPWAMQDAPQPLALLVGRPAAVAQEAIDEVSGHVGRLRSRVEQVLRLPVAHLKTFPGMMAVDLLLVGGSSDSGHKNFAHFFPLESPAGRTPGEDFTVVFSNMHVERLTRCSLALLEAVGGCPPDGIQPAQVRQASLSWFRSHDLAHFWEVHPSVEVPNRSLVPFEEMVLQETLADTLGLLAVAELVDATPLGAAFSSEMLRYLSRNHHEFADTTAAALEVGWLMGDVELPWGEPGRWLEVAVPSLARLARAVWAALRGSPDPIPDLCRALDEGRQLVARWYGPLAQIPTDLEYSFG